MLEQIDFIKLFAFVAFVGGLSWYAWVMTTDTPEKWALKGNKK